MIWAWPNYVSKPKENDGDRQGEATGCLSSGCPAKVSIPATSIMKAEVRTKSANWAVTRGRRKTVTESEKRTAMKNRVIIISSDVL